MSQFFKFPINYTYGHEAYALDAMLNRTGAAPQINDNDYRTSSTLKKFIIETHGPLNTNTTITHVFIKGQNITQYTISIPTGSGTGTGFSNRVIPADQTVRGFQHDLQPLTNVSASEIQVDIVGATSQVYEIMLLESIMTIGPIYQVVDPVRIDTTSQIRTNIKGNTFHISGVADRYKWNTNYSAFFREGDSPSWEDFVMNLETIPNMTFAEDFDEFPSRVYPATLASPLNIAYQGQVYTQARIDFTLTES